MSADLAVWEGERPADDKTASRVFSDLYDRYIEAEVEEPPSERIAAFVTKLLERWCDLAEGDEDTSPWSSSPLIGEASGPLIYFVDAGCVLPDASPAPRAYHLPWHHPPSRAGPTTRPDQLLHEIRHGRFNERSRHERGLLEEAELLGGVTDQKVLRVLVVHMPYCF